jgi:hypothetical protein
VGFRLLASLLFHSRLLSEPKDGPWRKGMTMEILRTKAAESGRHQDDMIYATSREVLDALSPVPDVAIVDHMVGTEGAHTFQLLVRRRGGDNRCTRHLRDLQRRDGNAAGVLRTRRRRGRFVKQGPRTV